MDHKSCIEGGNDLNEYPNFKDGCEQLIHLGQCPSISANTKRLGFSVLQQIVEIYPCRFGILSTSCMTDEPHSYTHSAVSKKARR